MDRRPWRRSDGAAPLARTAAGRRRELGRLRPAIRLASRPVTAGSAATCASYLGAAVRRFFAQGGRRAIVVRVGDPWPFMDAAGTRAANRTARIAPLVPQFVVPSLPFDPTDPRTWRGIQHLYGLPEASLVCMPDLADALRRRSGAARRDAAARADQRRLRRVQPLGSGSARRSRASPPSRAALGCGWTRRLDQRDRGDARVPGRHRRDVVCWRPAADGERRGAARSAGYLAAAERARWPTA